jgi:DNA-binding XRE family transcriptional regulator
MKPFDTLLEELGLTEEQRKRTQRAACVAQTVYRYRRQHDWSQAELAEKVGTSQPRIAAIENADTNPTLSTLGRLADAFGIPIEELVRDPQPVIVTAGWQTLDVAHAFDCEHGATGDGHPLALYSLGTLGGSDDAT